MKKNSEKDILDPNTIPRYDVRGIARRAQTWSQKLLFNYTNAQLSGKTYRNLLTDLHGLLPTVPIEVLRQSTNYLIGQEFLPEEAIRLCGRLAGNVQRLKRGISVQPWSQQSQPEWVPLQIKTIAEASNRKGELGGGYECKVLAGTPYGKLVNTFWTDKYVGYISRLMGFSREGARVFLSRSQLVGLFLYAHIDPQYMRDERPAFREIAFPSSTVTKNQTIIHARARTYSKTKCQGDHPQPLTVPCHRCPAGYLSKGGCPLATHTHTYVAGHCDRCQRDRVWLDPAQKHAICIECRHQGIVVLARHKRAENSVRK